MTELTRRGFAAAALGLGAAASALGKGPIQFGVMDSSLRLPGDPKALELAKKIGFEGIQVTLGQPGADGKLKLSSPELQKALLAESKRLDVALNGTYLDVLHKDCLKNNRKAIDWMHQGIEATKALKARILMPVFFGGCAISGAAEIDAVVAALKETAPAAEKAGVVIGIENTISAEDNLKIQDRVGSRAVQIYYDAGNATNIGKFDPVKEIRLLGKRICQYHIKDQGYFGEGKVHLPSIMRAIRETGFRGWVNLETNTITTVEDDMKRNLEYAQKSLALAKQD